MSRATTAEIVVVCVAIGGMVATSFVADSIAASSLSPPANADTFSDFAAAMPPARHLSIVHLQRGERIVWVGETASGFALPSGPPCYVFLMDGTLEEWVWDSGEGILGDAVSAAANPPNLSTDEVTDRIGNP